MRTIQWLYLIIVVVLVASTGLFVANARTAQKLRAFVTPAASVEQLMTGAINPAATAIFKAVSTVITAAGVQETAPKTDAEWEAVANSAAVLVESGNLLSSRSRRMDQTEWVKMSRALVDAARVSMDAARAKNAGALFTSGEALYLSCDRCHQRFMK